jgi:hypothetical protein
MYAGLDQRVLQVEVRREAGKELGTGDAVPQVSDLTAVVDA